MPLLENRLSQIAQLGLAGKKVPEIAQQLGLAESTIKVYERFMYRTLSRDHDNWRYVNTLAVAEKLKISPATLEQFIAYKRKRLLSKKERIEQIHQAIAQGVSSIDKIAEEIWLLPPTIKMYGWRTGIQQGPKKAKKADRLELIKEALELGFSSRKSIAEHAGLAPATLSGYASKAKIKLPPLETVRKATRAVQRPILDRYQQISQFVDSGITDSREIADQLGLSQSTVKSYLSGIRRMNKNRMVSPNDAKEKNVNLYEIEFVAKLRENLSQSSDEIADLITRQKDYARKVYRWNIKYDLGVPLHFFPEGKRKMAERSLTILELARQGYTLTQIAQQVPLTEERVRQIINKYDCYNEWRDKSEELSADKKSDKLHLSEERSKIIQILEDRQKELAYQQSWAWGKAVEYQQGLRRKTSSDGIHLKSLVKLFTTYEQAQKQGTKLSVDKLGEVAGISYPGVGRTLRRVGLETMFRTLDRHPTPKWKKEAIKRVYNSKVSSADIAYFLELEPHVIAQNNVRLRRKIKVKHSLYHNSREKGKALNYRMASQVYEAEDLGFNREEIRQLLDLGPKVAQYAFDHKTKIVPVIVQLLQVLYPEEKITTPYRWKGEK